MRLGACLRITLLRGVDYRKNPVWARVVVADDPLLRVRIARGEQIHPFRVELLSGGDVKQKLKNGDAVSSWVIGSNDERFTVVSDKNVPDEVWAEIAKRALLNDLAN